MIRKLVYPLTILVTAAVTFGIVMLLMNISDRKREAQEHYVQIVKLTEDTERGQSRWFRVGACLCSLPPIWGRPQPGIWGTRPERESNAARMR